MNLRSLAGCVLILFFVWLVPSDAQTSRSSTELVYMQKRLDEREQSASLHEQELAKLQKALMVQKQRLLSAQNTIFKRKEQIARVKALLEAKNSEISKAEFELSSLNHQLTNVEGIPISAVQHQERLLSSTSSIGNVSSNEFESTGQLLETKQLNYKDKNDMAALPIRRECEEFVPISNTTLVAEPKVSSKGNLEKKKAGSVNSVAKAGADLIQEEAVRASRNATKQAVRDVFKKALDF